MHLVDTSALVALLTDEPIADWVESTLNTRRKLGGVFINPIVYGELCALFDSEQAVLSILRGVVDRADLPWQAAFPAGKAYRLYKTRGGKKTRMLPDFLIAAHADALGWTLITNNASDVKHYFPELKVLQPD